MEALPDSRVIFNREEISNAIDRLAAQVAVHCMDEEWLAICIMHGGLIFTSELLLRLPLKIKLDFVRVSRYRESVSGGELEWISHHESDLEGANILLIDDIYDEGNTLFEIGRECLNQGAARILSVVLVEKVHDRKIKDHRPDLVGLTCGDQYVFGFGMDIGGFWRNLPEIRELIT